MPQMAEIDVITVEREFGAGGSELAAALGRRLGWRVVDRDFVAKVAERLAVDEDAVAARDEHAPGLLERIGTTILRTSPEMLSLPPDQTVPDPLDVAQAAGEVLAEEAGWPPVILVGHAAQALLRRRDGTLCVRLVAPLASRVERICQRTGQAGHEAAGLAQRVDADRAAYTRRYFHEEWGDATAYHLVINTGLLAIDEAAETIVRLIDARRADRGPTRREPRPASQPTGRP